MDTFHGYELVREWRATAIIKATYGKKEGKLFYIKQYQTPVIPLNNGSLDKRTFDRNKQFFEQFVSRRVRLNTALRTIVGIGGGIVVPVEEFVEENHYVEVLECLDGVVPIEERERVLNELSLQEKKLFMLTAAGALGAVHGQGIIHGDVKEDNVLLVKNTFSGICVAKLIGLENAFFTDDIPEATVGDIRYFSPELAAYLDEEDDKASLKSTLTTKLDIFSLGLVFHRYLTGEFPQAVSLTEYLQRRKDAGKPVYCWNVLLSGGQLQISDKIPDFYRRLITAMLEKDPTKRPTATEIIQCLKDIKQ